jgi:hypothetical protein
LTKEYVTDETEVDEVVTIRAQVQFMKGYGQAAYGCSLGRTWKALLIRRREEDYRTNTGETNVSCG